MTTLPTIRLAGLALICSTPALRAQTALYSFEGSAANSWFGNDVAGGGDLDGDGVPDLLVAAERAAQGGVDAGAIYAYSGADGSQLYRVDGINGGDRLAGPSYAGEVLVRSGATGGHIWIFSGKPDLNGDGWGDILGVSVDGMGDADLDGVPDILVGAPGDFHVEGWCPPGTDTGYAQVYSGATGALLHTVYGSSNCDDFGRTVAGLGDLNLDGYAEFAVGASQTTLTTGYARIFSGQDKSVLKTLFGKTVGDFHGLYIANGGDVNGDGASDLLVGSSEYSFVTQTFGAGRVDVYSGWDYSNLHTVNGTAQGDAFGQRPAGLGDVDGDGRDDFVVGAWGADGGGGPGSGTATVYSGSSGSVLYALAGGGPGDAFGFAVSAAGDLNGDGRRDLLVGSMLNDVAGSDAGSARAFSSETLALDADRYQLSTAAGGTQQLQLDAGPAFASEPYLVLGSLTGISPGFPIDNLILPVNFDPYFLYTLQAPNPVHFPGSLGILNGQGRATAGLTLPPAAPPPWWA